MKSAHIPDRNTLHIAEQLRSDVALRRILLLELEIMEFNEGCLTRQYDVECLHDYRVALRRSRVLLSRFQGVFPMRETRRFAAALARLGKLTGPCRDLDVFLAHWPEYVSQSDEACQQVFNYLLQQRDHAREGLLNEWRGQKHLLFKKQWRDFLSAEAVATRMPHAKTPVSVMAGKQVDKVLYKTAKKLKSVTQQSPDQKLHKLRITCKQLRYLLDYFQGIEANDACTKLVADLKKLQDKLGLFQDLAVQGGVISEVDTQITAAGMMSSDVRQVVRSIENTLNARAVNQREVVMAAISKFLRSDAFVSMLDRN